MRIQQGPCCSGLRRNVDVEQQLRAGKVFWSIPRKSRSKVALERIADMVCYAPTASNSQSRRLKIITGVERRKDLMADVPGTWRKPPAISVISMDYGVALKQSGK